MILFSQSAEMRCVRTLAETKIPEKFRSTLLGKLSENHFHYPPAKAAFTRIKKIARKRQELIDYEDLREDPSLEEDFRDVLKETNARPCKNKSAMERMFSTLEQFRKIRIAYETCKETFEQLKDDKIDVDEILDKMGDSLMEARRDVEAEQKIVSFGEKGNVDNLVHSVLYSVEELRLKTGYTEYDERNGGVPSEGVMIIGATTSGGKSVTTMNLLKQLHMLNKISVCRVSFEMGEEQEMRRFLSCVSGIPFGKFVKKRLSPKEKEAVKEAVAKFNKFGKKHKIKFSTISPTRSMAIDEVLRMLKPYGYKVVAIDYITLLAGVDSDNQWRILSEIARFAKEFSRQTKSLVILLAQLDDMTEKLRYSKGIREHADVYWYWNYSDPKQREMKILPIQVGKDRDGELFKFELAERFEMMRVENPANVGSKDDSEESISEATESDDLLSSKATDDDDESEDLYAGTGAGLK